MNIIRKTKLHPDGDYNVTLYPETSADQIQGLLEYLPEAFRGNGITSIELVGSEEGTGEQEGYTLTTFKITTTDNPNGEEYVIPAKNGAKIVKSHASVVSVVNDYTETRNILYMSDDSSFNLTTMAKNGANGANGKDGNGIVSVTTLGYEEGTGQYEGYTKTNLNVDTNDSTIPIEVYAKNGSSQEYSQQFIYVHYIKLNIGAYTLYLNLVYPSVNKIDGDDLCTYLEQRRLTINCSGNYGFSSTAFGVILYVTYETETSLKLGTLQVTGVGGIVEQSFNSTGLNITDNVVSIPCM